MLTVKLIKPWDDKSVGTLCRLADATAESLVECGQAEFVIKVIEAKPKPVAKPATRMFGKKPVTDTVTDNDDG